MDRIESCSLNVNADAAKTSDTVTISAALDRCSLNQSSNHPSKAAIFPGNTIYELKSINQPFRNVSELPQANDIVSPGKKPSYLNLACCVNGYSSITAYKSKSPKDIEKSRDVLPIRPSTNSFQYCKKSNKLTPPLQLVMPNLCASMSPLSQTSSVEMKKNYVKNGRDFYDNLEHKTRNSDDKKKSTSFIQQRVERLYGPGALAHGFYSPKNIKASFVNTSAKCNNTFPPSGDYDTLNKNDMVTIESVKNKATEKCEKNMNQLPVLRHVSEEFRAQLPLISINRNQIRKMEKQYSDHINNQEKIPHLESNSFKDEVDHETTKINNIGDTEIIKSDMSTEAVLNVTNAIKREENSTIEKELDGEYFLKILRTEQSRLLTLAERAEKYIELLSNNTGVAEDIFGILRSASGKARLLVTQKMKQFEGLCYKNIHKPLDDTFPTTVEDLQGFWDMVYLQVSNINETFDEIEILRKNNWKKTIVESSAKGIQQTSLKDKKSKAKSLPNRDISKINSEMSVAKIKREAQRKQLMEFKRKHKMALAGNSVIIPADDVKSKPNVSDAFFIDKSS